MYERTPTYCPLNEGQAFDFPDNSCRGLAGVLPGSCRVPAGFLPGSCRVPAGVLPELRVALVGKRTKLYRQNVCVDKNLLRLQTSGCTHGARYFRRSSAFAFSLFSTLPDFGSNSSATPPNSSEILAKIQLTEEMSPSSISDTGR